MITDKSASLARHALVLASLACAAPLHQESKPMNAAASTETQTQNPLLAPWSGPYGGVPGFAGVRVEDFEPALEQAMRESRAELEALTNDPAPPSFDNTCAAFERMGRTLQRVGTVYNVWESTLKGPELQAVEREMAPRLAAFRDEIVQNEKLYQRVAAVHAQKDQHGVTPEQQRLVWHQYTDLVLAGAKVAPAEKARPAESNQRLATLFTDCRQNGRSDEETSTGVPESGADLEGLPASLRASAAAAAEEREL